MEVRKMTIREALIAMGYKEVAARKWMKPMGYQLFSYNEDNNNWTNWFTSVKDEIVAWDSHSFDSQYNPLSQIKDWESYTRHDLVCNSNSTFELRAIDI